MSIIQHIAAQGRNGDNNLVHMNTGELRALQGIASLSGKSITRNPKTGLPEAFSLKGMLPAIAGIAGGMMGIPTPLLGLGVGALSGLSSGSLTQGILAGLTAGSMGNLAGSLSEGASAIGGAGMPTTALPGGFSDAAQTASKAGFNVADANPSDLRMLSSAPDSYATSQAAPATFQDRISNLPNRFGNMIDNLQDQDKLKTTFLTDRGTPNMATMGAMSGINGLSDWQMQKNAQDALNSRRNRNKSAFGSMGDPVGYVRPYAQGGIASLGDTGFLKGPGDGMSDSIPAAIDGKNPARLATEEFVVPADVVSHIGNGSSEAGAKQLYDMMDRVRQARTGSIEQGKKINPDKYLPG